MRAVRGICRWVSPSAAGTPATSISTGATSAAPRGPVFIASTIWAGTASDGTSARNTGPTSNSSTSSLMAATATSEAPPTIRSKAVDIGRPGASRSGVSRNIDSASPAHHTPICDHTSPVFACSTRSTAPAVSAPANAPSNEAHSRSGAPVMLSKSGCGRLRRRAIVSSTTAASSTDRTLATPHPTE